MQNSEQSADLHVIQNAMMMNAVMNSLSQVIGIDAGGVGAGVNRIDTLMGQLRWQLLSNLRQQLSEAYVEKGIIQNVVDVPVDDAFRGGVKITSKQLDENQLLELHQWLDGDLFDPTGDFFDTDATEGVLTGVVAQAHKWKRLYGGGGILIINGEDRAEPLRPTRMKEGDPLKFRDIDLWELYYSFNNHDGYKIEEPWQPTDHYDYYGVKVHKSRVMRIVGIKPPSFIRPRLRGWGLSVIESMIASINQYLRSNSLAYEVLKEFKVDVYKLKNLASTLAALDGGEKVRKRVELANQQKSFQDAVLLDAEDDFSQKQITFSGLAEMMSEFRLQISSDMRMPCLKLFGVSPKGGLNSSSEEELEVYNGMVESAERNKSRMHIKKMIALECQVRYGFIPTDLSLEHAPLRVLSAVQEEEVKNHKFNRMMQARTAGEMDSKEFKEACNREKLLPVQVDVNRETLQMEPEPGEEGEGGAEKKETENE